MEIQGVGGCSINEEEHLETSDERGSGGGLTAKMGHDTTNDQLFHISLPEPVLKVGSEKRVILLLLKDSGIQLREDGNDLAHGVA